MTALGALGSHIGLGAMTSRARAMATFGLVRQWNRRGPWRRFTQRRGRIIRTGVDNRTGVGLIATG